MFKGQMSKVQLALLDAEAPDLKSESQAELSDWVNHPAPPIS